MILKLLKFQNNLNNETAIAFFVCLHLFILIYLIIIILHTNCFERPQKHF